MKLLSLAAAFVGALVVGCAGQQQLVYSSGFSFANYDYVIIDKPDGPSTDTALYGMDVEFANLLSRYNMKVLGRKEIANLPQEVKERTLEARMSLAASNNRIVLSVSFDNMVTGRTGASVTSAVAGDIFDVDERTEAFEVAAETLVRALENDKKLQITGALSQESKEVQSRWMTR